MSSQTSPEENTYTGRVNFQEIFMHTPLNLISGITDVDKNHSHEWKK